MDKRGGRRNERIAGEEKEGDKRRRNSEKKNPRGSDS